MDVSIIIVNYNTYKVTANCIESIYKYTSDVSFEVLVVDNASNDNIVELLSKDSRINLIISSTNIGFGKANNLGYTFAKGKYIFLLNSDTILLNNALKMFYDFAESSSNEIACIGCILVNKKGNMVHSFSQFPSTLTILRTLLGMYLRPLRLKVFDDYEHKKINSVLPIQVDYITGADLFIKKSIIDRLGLFDPDFFMYFEETELQLRYKKAGHSSIIINGPSIIHLEGSSFEKEQNHSFKRRIMFTQSMFLYMRKKYNVYGYLLFRFVYLFILPIIIFSRFSYKEKIDLLKQIIIG